uniref:Ig-like domain-containing protein n=1 Tax=Ornithorhynchus anatinus TaxID=9258 RepID=A0A6I8PCT6_ORNAN
PSSSPGSTTCLLCDFDQVTSLLCASGEPVTLNCSYDPSYPTLLWFRQDSKGILKFVLSESTVDPKYQDRFQVHHNLQKRVFSLMISEVRISDSATYYCCVNSGSSQNKLIFGTGTRLLVRPNVTNPQPRMYHLKKPRVNDLSVCLFTDFGNEEVNMMGINNIKRTPSMVAEKRLASKSLGIVAWNNNLDWKCQAKISNITYSFHALPCPAGSRLTWRLCPFGFADPYLNSINLAMIFLRVIFVKTVGFNLLMTLKLWSS